MKNDMEGMKGIVPEFNLGDAVRFRGSPEGVWFVTGVVIRAGARMKFMVSLCGDEVEVEGYELAHDEGEEEFDN